MEFSNAVGLTTLMLAALIASAGPPPVAKPSSLRTAPHRAVSKGEGTRVLEIRSYNLKPGVRDRFQKRFVEVSLPLLEKYKVDVVAYGPSLHDADSWFLMRSYANVDDRQRGEDAFYGSDDWKKGPREAVMADIETYNTIVVQVDDATLEGLRRLPR